MVLDIFRKIKRRLCKCVNKLFDCFFCHLSIKNTWYTFQTEGDFCDNGRALYEYLRNLQDGKKRKFIWFVSNPSNFKRSKDTLFLKFHSSGLRVRTFYYFRRARFIFETHNLIYESLRPAQTYISLIHGFGFKAPMGSIGEKKYIDYYVNTSTLTIKYVAQFFSAKHNQFLPLGFARNDMLINNKGKGQLNPLLNCQSYAKVVIWMTTFKESWNESLSVKECTTNTGLPLLSTEEIVKVFNKWLYDNNILIIIKVHHLQAEKPIFDKSFSNIRFVEDGVLQEHNLQLYEVLAKSDALITDYSSVYVDYMLLDKPMGFVFTDIEEYKKGRGFIIDNIEDMSPGSHIYNINDLKTFFEYLIQNKDEYREKRHELLSFYHDNPDNKSCERIKDFFNL